MAGEAPQHSPIRSQPACLPAFLPGCCLGLALPCRLHSGGRGNTGFVEDLVAMAGWRQQMGPKRRPSMVWMDVPLQVWLAGLAGLARLETGVMVCCKVQLAWWACIKQAGGLAGRLAGKRASELDLTAQMASCPRLTAGFPLVLQLPRSTLTGLAANIGRTC